MSKQALDNGSQERAAAVADKFREARALNRRGISWLQAGYRAAALEDFRRAALLQPDYPEPWNNSGLVRQMLGQFTAAVADFDQALAIRPDYPEALCNRGRTRQLRGDTAGALEDFDRAVELASATLLAASMLHNRGMLRQERGDVAGARADFDRALEIDPGHTATYVSRGNLRKETGDLPGALDDFDRALEKNPSQGRAAIYHGRGGVRVLFNDFAGAVADYDRALTLEPQRFEFYISRGNAYYHRRDPSCLLDFRRAFRLDPDGAARELLRFLMTEVKRDAEAVLENCRKHLRVSELESRTKYVRRKEHDAIAHARRGLTLLLLSRNVEAAPDLARVRDMLPDMVPHLERLMSLAANSRAVNAHTGTSSPLNSYPGPNADNAKLRSVWDVALTYVNGDPDILV